MEKVKFLAIDDHADNLIVLKALLNEAFPPATFIGSQSGKQGIELCHSEKPDVVLLDIVMPEIDGYEVCRILKADEVTRNIPIVMITAARTDKESRIKALESGADAFLTKPIDESELMAQIRAMLRIKQSEDRKLDEMERLEILVSERTRQLENELKERMLSEEKLIHSEEKYRMFIDLAPDAFFQGSRIGNLIDVNHSAVELTGYDRGELLKLNMKDLFSADCLQSKPLVYNLLNGGETIKTERELTRKDGQLVFVEMNSKKMPDGTYQSFIRDVTFRKQAELALRESEELFRGLFNVSPNAINLIDPHHPIISWPIVDCNEATCQMNGYSREELIGHSIDVINPIEGKQEERADFYNNLKQQGVNQHEVVHRHKDGHLFPVEVSTSLVILGGQEMILGIDRDITERKQAETELREKEVQYRNLANSGTALIWTSGTDKLCNYFNNPWLNFTGRTLEQETGNGWAEGVHPDDLDSCIQTFITAFDKREPFEMEYRLMHVSGEYRWLLDMGTPNYNLNGEFIGYIGHCFDINDRKKMETELLVSKEKAEESDRLKSAFLANMSHEIRTPLNSIIGFSDLLLDPDFGQDQRDEFIRMIGASGNNLLNIINDIIDLSKIESGQISFKISRLSIQKLIGDIQKEYSYRAVEKGIELRLDPSTSNLKDIYFESDELRLKQIH
jgi:PAS domain S-box-containing protein